MVDTDERSGFDKIILRDSHGLEKVILKEPSGSTAQVHLFGGQLTSWKNDQEEELLFMSSKETYKPPKALRGGIPICFPQHGFVRNRIWSIDLDPPPISINSSNNKAVVDLLYKSNEDDLKIWPRSFELRLRVALARGGDLTLTVRVRNTDTKPLTFTIALHTYFSVSDSSEVRIEGLETLDYMDNLEQKERFTEQGDAITFDAEVDRFYLSTPTKLAIIDHQKKRTFVLRKEGLPDAGVWNPWDKKSRALPDFGDEEYKDMVCVGAAAFEKPIALKPAEEWKGRQALSHVPSSYFSGRLDPIKVLG
ncbi:hypothetical protein O6H91_01G080900 [Diphasiastrum complanatum]|uniref:Uncharacterized protein n=4 Tax=Diphasiastrum complanatum TaxID=34168 RepID=A0ACC2ESS1_DIPCM|nr:hypothetical protein O6H91_01G027600 [Diphasiastrum complanatum]KAJ7568314.1 hypothetical protein O6H91_01G027600 [Diphasiastrum complanatum]KAJ7568315.1 hypothetical protein O6H91_01G027600 [Diphasiastrum complanatum]KAJ7569492.1 hypothetical protein O6H91_01G080900 [Diphasiastrum complanatum]